MRIHVLIEDTPVEGYKTEHGLSLMIEYNGKQYLLDAGTSDAFLENAEKMSIDVKNVQFSVLSHGHYDHSGGYARYLAENPEVKVYAMETAGGDYYSGNGGVIHYAGVPKDVLPVFANQFIFIHKVTQIAEDIYLVPHSTSGLEKLGERALLYKKCGEEYLPDDFAHEQSLVFDTEEGIVIFNSCSHAGMPVIIEEVKKVFPGKAIYAFVGGLHMKGKRDSEEICIFPEEEMKEIAKYLKETGLKKLYTGHCTGKVAYQMLEGLIGEMIGKLDTGKVIEL